MTAPLVSILVPAFNHERYVISCLDSIAADTYPNRELIIIDDGSRDGTLALVRQWAEGNEWRFARVAWSTQENQGVCATLNRLVETAHGSFLALLASDDELVPGGVQARVTALQQHPEWLAVFGAATVIDDAGRQLASDAMRSLYRTDGAMLHGARSLAVELILHWSAPGPVLMTRREAFDPSVGVGRYDATLPMEDRDFYLRLLGRDALGYVDAPVGRYRRHATNATKARSATVVRFREALLESCVRNLSSFSGFPRLCLAEYVRYLQSHAEYQRRRTPGTLSTLAVHRTSVGALLQGSRVWYRLRRAIRFSHSFAMNEQRGQAEPHVSLTIVLVNYEGWIDTIECLESLMRSTYRNFAVVVVDNASKDGSIEHLLAWSRGEVDVWIPPDSPHRGRVWPPAEKPLPVRVVDGRFEDLEGSVRDARVSLVASARNAGFGAGNNLGMAFAIASGAEDGYFWLLNNDTVVDAGAVERIARELESARGILGTRLMEYGRPEYTQAVGGGRLGRFKMRAIPCPDHADPATLEFVNGASMLLPLSFFAELGGFDEAIFMYQEEIDLCLRARTAGCPIGVSPIKVYHKGGASSTSYRQSVWSFTSHYYVLRKHFGLGPWIVAHFAKLLFLSIFPFGSTGKRRAARTVLWRTLRGRSA